jgi:hypothetical protein
MDTYFFVFLASSSLLDAEENAIKYWALLAKRTLNIRAMQFWFQRPFMDGFLPVAFLVADFVDAFFLAASSSFFLLLLLIFLGGLLGSLRGGRRLFVALLLLLLLLLLTLLVLQDRVRVRGRYLLRRLLLGGLLGGLGLALERTR